MSSFVARFDGMVVRVGLPGRVRDIDVGRVGLPVRIRDTDGCHFSLPTGFRIFGICRDLSGWTLSHHMGHYHVQEIVVVKRLIRCEIYNTVLALHPFLDCVRSYIEVWCSVYDVENDVNILTARGRGSEACGDDYLLLGIIGIIWFVVRIK